MLLILILVIPAQAGIQNFGTSPGVVGWIPAFAGMTPTWGERASRS